MPHLEDVLDDEDFDDDDDPAEGALVGLEVWVWTALQTYLLKRQFAGDMEASALLKELEDNTFEID
jgi:hypothetical protein